MSACPVCGEPSYDLPSRLAERRRAMCAHDPASAPPLPCARHAWERITAALAEPNQADELLDPTTPIEAVDQALRDAGLDPEQIAADGRAFVERLRAGGAR